MQSTIAGNPVPLLDGLLSTRHYLGLTQSSPALWRGGAQRKTSEEAVGTMSDIRIELEGIRGLIAAKMQESLQRTAQLSFFTDIDATALVAARAAHKAQGIKLGYEDLIIHELIGVIGSFELSNLVEIGGAAERIAAVNVGCAIALDGALVAPAILNANTLSLEEIAERRADLVERAKVGRLTIEEQTSGTITLSNLGLTRVQHFTPILMYPQLAILGLGQIATRPWIAPDGETIEARPVMGLSLTVDHRFIDGAPAGAFLTELANGLETLDAPG